MDINDQIANNLGLVYQQLRRFKLTDDQDAESFAYEALYRAVLTYDASTGTAFSTYAVCIIANELRKHIRTLHKKRQLSVISYDTPSTYEDNDSTLVDSLKHADDTESVVLFNELTSVVEESFNKVYNELNETHRRIISMWYASDYKLTQNEISKALHISQPTVSKALSHFKYKLRMELEEYM